MKVSVNWLKEYISFDMSEQELAEALTMVGLEVEALEDRFQYLESVIVAKITCIAPHKKSERLSCCTVDSGEKKHEVVCGASNVKVGMLSALALPGAELPGIGKIGKSVIRGAVSEGMLLSESELGIGLDTSGIMIIEKDVPLGLSLKKVLALSDFVLEIGLTPNRPDCLGVLGIAREVAAICGKKVKYPKISVPEERRQTSDAIDVLIEAKEKCSRYVARVIDDVTVSSSPFWLQDRLLSIGIRPINAVVDVTNYVMMETGQPLHGFDYALIQGKKIIVKDPIEGEQFETLDNKDHKLSSGMVMIADAQKNIAIGGVMGGLNSEIAANTSSILLESAYFNPTVVRKTSKKLTLNTEASHRFERGVDPSGQLFALERATHLLCDILGAKAMKDVIDVSFTNLEPRSIKLSVSKTNALLGTHLTLNKMMMLLKSIEFGVKKEGTDLLSVTVPSFRVDIFRSQDLIEEIARLSGYDSIPTSYPEVSSKILPESPLLSHRWKARELMTGFGFTECINYSFISKNAFEKMGFQSDDDRKEGIELLNPLSEDLKVMRTSLLPGLLETAHRNLSQQVKQLKIFETGRIFLKTKDERPSDEIEMLAGLWTGDGSFRSVFDKKISVDFYQMKGVLEGLFAGFGIHNVQFTAYPKSLSTYVRPGHTAQMIASDLFLGVVGEISNEIRLAYDLKQTAYIFELNIDVLSQLIPDSLKYQAIAKYPSTMRDMTLIVDKNIEAQVIINSIYSLEESLIESVSVFDVFDKSPIPKGKKSLSLRVVYRSKSGTLVDSTVNDLHQTMTAQIVEQHNAGLPV